MMRKLCQTLLVLCVAAVTMFSVASPASAATKLSQSEAASQLSAVGVTWSSSGNCTTRSNSTCTSFDQINQSTVTGVVTLKKASGCALNITGGTEVGHASGTQSHYNGYKVDIAKATCINDYVKNSFTKIADRGDGYPQWRSSAGNTYCDEGNHWGITYI
ncbi:hypothetical protein RSal33209_1872 [Renibacterium salmoninarum ATCC 33209]|uniref:Uncharacterized protein n=2 Tax=Renibacterium salmoninarum TaxID=1646 RepID=A9WQP8_RENSM|nr:hypothetical protein [Renibacterium salmoninarum]ABY23605.1 hypothetical protein RSal33209_1872 [Renibacterium salmoninarum ATCC 33209]